VPEDSVDGADAPPITAPLPARSNRTVTPAVAGALVVLAASFALSVAFVLANGGLDLPAAAHAPGGSGSPDAGGLGATPSTAGASAPTASSPAPIASAGTSPSAEPSVAAEPSQSAAQPGPSGPSGQSAAPASAPPASASAPTPGSSSNRYDLLTACPDTTDCWVYVVRAGDNLVSIAHYFGVSLSAVEERNPWTTTTQLVAGQKLLLPTPTR
jgi:LysM repeat protein